MVMKAMVTLKERQGSSLPAIKKYISANYKVGGQTDHSEATKLHLDSLLSVFHTRILLHRTNGSPSSMVVDLQLLV
jgi:hypothetical protein